MWSWRGAQTAPLLQTGGGIKAEGFEEVGEKATESFSAVSWKRIGVVIQVMKEEPEVSRAVMEPVGGQQGSRTSLSC